MHEKWSFFNVHEPYTHGTSRQRSHATGTAFPCSHARADGCCLLDAHPSVVSHQLSSATKIPCHRLSARADGCCLTDAHPLAVSQNYRVFTVIYYVNVA